MLTLLPVYEGGSTPGTEPVRRAALRGFVVGVYRLGNLLDEDFRVARPGTASGSRWSTSQIVLIRSSSPICPHATPPPGEIRSAPGPAATTLPLDAYGRSWELTVHPTGAGFTDSRDGFMAILLLAALAVTFLLEGFLLVLSGMESMARRLISEVGSAARYVASILPRDPRPRCRSPPATYLPGARRRQLRPPLIDDDHLIAYIVDVSNHGVAPAMITVSVHNVLRSGTLDNDTLRRPDLVLAELNRLFRMDQQAGNYFTIWYCVYQPSTGTLSYAGAGHPPALLLTADGAEPLLPGLRFHPDRHRRGHRVRNPQPGRAREPTCCSQRRRFDLPLRGGEHGNLEDFIDLCARTARSPEWTLDQLIQALRKQCKSGTFTDDCTLVRLSFPTHGRS